MCVRVELGGVAERIEQLRRAALRAAAKQALQDCNEYCPKDGGGLIASSYRHSDVENGRLVWATPYARRRFYRSYPSERMSGRTSGWTEHAKRAHLSDWERAAQRGMEDAK